MDINAIKQRLNSLQSTNTPGKKEKIDYSKVYWKPKEEGKYQIRIVPSKLNPQNPFQEVFVHYGFSKFPIYALTNWGEKDPIVEFAKQLRTTNDRENWVLAKKLDPKMRIFAPVIVRGEEEKGVRLWEFGKEIYMQLLGIAEDEVEAELEAAPVKNYALKTPATTKASKAEKFDALFDDEDDNDLPF